MSTNPSNTYIVIMAGGVGSRFWPASREDNPKQFHDILGTGKSLLRMTFERFQKLAPDQNILVITNERYRDLVLEHLPELTARQVLVEPSRNNTAPSVAYTAFHLKAKNPSANVVIAPSDAYIGDEDAFVKTLQTGLEFTAANEAIVTLGITPSNPHTGYGYIEFDRDSASTSMVLPVKSFKEKPDLETAKTYLAAGTYLWNAGIFLFKAETMLRAFDEYAPDIYNVLQSTAYDTAQEEAFINEHYPKTTKISVDYAIMEKANNVFTIPSSFGWSDVGSWEALYQQLPKDADGNAHQLDLPVIENVHNCFIRLPEGKMLVARDLRDLIIVDEGNVLLVFPRANEQDIKKTRQDLHDRGLTDYI